MRIMATPWNVNPVKRGNPGSPTTTKMPPQTSRSNPDVQFFGYVSV